MKATAPSPATLRLQRVHQAVRELMSEQGFRISMEAVALRAGCSKQTLYAQFGSKQALIHSMIQEHLDNATAPLQDSEADLRESLILFAVEHLERLSDPGVLASSQLICAEARQFPEEAQSIFLGSHGRMLERLSDHLHKAMRRGRIRHDDPHSTAELLLSMITGSDFERQRFSLPHRDTVQLRRQWVEFAIDTFLRAFAPLPTSMQHSAPSHRR